MTRHEKRALSPRIHLQLAVTDGAPSSPPPACGGGTGRGHAKRMRVHAKRIKRARSPPPQPSPACGGGADRACCALTDERDGVDVAPVVALVAMGGAAVAEEPGRVGIGAVPEVLDSAHAGGGEARGDIAGKIEQG